MKDYVVGEQFVRAWLFPFISSIVFVSFFFCTSQAYAAEVVTLEVVPGSVNVSDGVYGYNGIDDPQDLNVVAGELSPTTFTYLDDSVSTTYTVSYVVSDGDGAGLDFVVRDATNAVDLTTLFSSGSLVLHLPDLSPLEIAFADSSWSYDDATGVSTFNATNAGVSSSRIDFNGADSVSLVFHDAPPILFSTLTAVTGQDAVGLSWDLNRTDGVSSFEYSVDDGVTWNSVPGSTQSTVFHSLSGLLSDTLYTFKVRVKNAAAVVLAVSDSIAVLPNKIAFGYTDLPLSEGDQFGSAVALSDDGNLSSNWRSVE